MMLITVLKIDELRQKTGEGFLEAFKIQISASQDFIKHLGFEPILIPAVS